MPRFFVTLISDGQRSEDDVGSDLPDVEAALAEARSTIQEIVIERLKMGDGPLYEEVEVQDGDGLVLLRRRITITVDDDAVA